MRRAIVAQPAPARSLFDDFKTGTRSRVPQASVISRTTPRADHPSIALVRFPKPTRMNKRITTYPTAAAISFHVVRERKPGMPRSTAFDADFTGSFTSWSGGLAA
jgi:hypothetical protein